MLQRHRKEIYAYEARFGVKFDGTNGTRNMINEGNNDPDYKHVINYFDLDKINTVNQAFDAAKITLYQYLYGRSDLPDLLKTKLSENNIVSTNIYLNPHEPTDAVQWSVLDSLDYETGVYINGANDLMIGMDQSGFQFDLMHGRKGNDILIGEGGNDGLWGDEGNDILHGGEGNDWLYGGIDNDTMYGGAGEDTYIFKYGDGNDTFIDSNGTIPTENSNIIYEDALGNKHDLGTLFNSGGGIDFTADGLIMYSNGVFSLPGGGTIALSSSDPLLDAFGINLITLPANPGTDNTINGDLAPMDMDPGQGGIQYGYDQWGNVIVDPSQPSPGREDYLDDTSDNDQIVCGAGDDQVMCSYGVANWILGGEGCDILDGENSSSCIIEGGADSDIVFGDVNGNGEHRGLTPPTPSFYYGLFSE
jgi:hypothetical protein